MNEGLYGWERGEKLYKSSIHIWNSQEIKKIKICSWLGTWEMAQWVRALVCEHEDLHSNPQHPCKAL